MVSIYFAMRCHSVACGTAGKTRSAMQSATQNFTAGHTMPSSALYDEAGPFCLAERASKCGGNVLVIEMVVVQRVAVIGIAGLGRLEGLRQSRKGELDSFSFKGIAKRYVSEEIVQEDENPFGCSCCYPAGAEFLAGRHAVGIDIILVVLGIGCASGEASDVY